MFEGISAIGWLVIVCALLLGFGVVRFMIAASKDRSSGLPAAEPQPAAQTWHAVLGVAPDAPIQAIRRAYETQRALYEASRLASMAPDLRELAERKRVALDAAFERARAMRS